MAKSVANLIKRAEWKIGKTKKRTSKRGGVENNVNENVKETTAAVLRVQP